MPELIERGYLYIAQPPLFKVKRGKSERYIKDEPGLEDYLLSIALGSVSVTPNGATDALAPEALRRLLECASYYRAILDRMSLRRLDSRIVDATIWCGVPREAELADEPNLGGDIAARLAERMEGQGRNGVDPITWTTSPDPEHGGFRLVAETRRAGIVLRTSLDTDFVRSPDFQRLAELATEISDLGEAPFRVQRGDAQADEIIGPVELLEHLLKLGEKGQSIQRYKGLGEMNPDQLADTTLDAGSRTLLQVRIPDAVEADETFTTLMGDNVEPRREFIEKNALDVQNLDV
jgi:DNA gyrase subunit B